VTTADDAWSAKQKVSSFGKHFDLPDEKRKFLNYARFVMN